MCAYFLTFRNDCFGVIFIWHFGPYFNGIFFIFFFYFFHQVLIISITTFEKYRKQIWWLCNSTGIFSYLIIFISIFLLSHFFIFFFLRKESLWCYLEMQLKEILILVNKCLSWHKIHFKLCVIYNEILKNKIIKNKISAPWVLLAVQIINIFLLKTFQIFRFYVLFFCYFFLSLVLQNTVQKVKEKTKKSNSRYKHKYIPWHQTNRISCGWAFIGFF